MGPTSAKIASAPVIYSMAIRSRAELLTFLALFLLIFIVFFALFSQLLEVPLWWIFRGLPLLGTRAEPLNVTVAPGPYSVGDRILVTVRAAVGGYPVENASVAVYRNCELMYSVLTNSTGQAVIRYPGETTVIIVSKEGYLTGTRVLPRDPEGMG